MDSRQAVCWLNSLTDVPSLLLVSDVSELAGSSALGDLAGHLRARLRPSLAPNDALETGSQILHVSDYAQTQRRV